MIRRHSGGAIFMHWFNAACWITLLLSGFALIDNAELQPVGMWYVDAWHALLAPQDILVLHVTLGVVWAAVYAVYVLLRLKGEAVPFLKEIFSFSLRSDLIWLYRKILHLTVGEEIMRRKNMATELPPQGFYNAGQKMFAVPAVLCSLGLVATGGVMFFSRSWPDGTAAVQWAIGLHFLFAALTALGLPVHIYMATIAPGEGPAFRSMFTGYVPRDFARHHNALWYDKVAK
jgi:formate dehydrogenase subunit gamma